MKALLWVDEAPLRKKLQKELNELSCRLVELERSLDHYFTRDLPQFQAWVNHQFADQLLQIADLEKRVHSLGHHVEESIQISVEMNMSPADLFADWTEEQIMEKIMAEPEVIDSPESELLEPPSRENASDEAREVYRRVVRCLHPDLRSDGLSEIEKNLWVRAQKAYAQNDTFELKRIEQNLRCGNLKAEPLSCSEMLTQISDFEKKFSELQRELECLKGERAWNFSEKKTLTDLEHQVNSEYRAALKDLKGKESHLQKTLCSWISEKAPAVPVKPAKRRVHKSQESLF